MENNKNEILNIENKIYVIDDKQVMLDSDLAELFGVETKRINEAVKNNIKKFPREYSWKLTNEETKIFLVENFDQKKETRGGRYKNPRVFTEEGIFMLATILKSETAVKMSIKIVESFVKMRHFLIDNKDIYKSLNDLNLRLSDTEDKVDKLFSKFDKKEYLYLENSEFDAYSDIMKILKNSKENIIIVDPYVDITLLDTIRNLKTQITLITQRRTRLTKTEVDKYNAQYNNLTFIKDSSFHDRYLIIDNKDIYHLGASINHAGNKVFSIHKIEEKDVKKALIKTINNILTREKINAK